MNKLSIWSNDQIDQKAKTTTSCSCDQLTAPFVRHFESLPASDLTMDIKLSMLNQA